MNNTVNLYTPVPEREHDIEIWDTPRRPILLSEDPLKSSVQVAIRNTKFSGMPVCIEALVEAEWNLFQKANPQAQDNMTTYHATYDRGEGVPEDVSQRDTVDIHLRTAGFRYQQVFNRTPKNKKLLSQANAYGVLTCSTHAHIVTSDGFLVYGTKKNQFDQISGFGGFPQVSNAHYDWPLRDDTGEPIGDTKLDMRKAVVERLRSEIGLFADKIDSVQYVGFVFSGRIAQGLRGTDLDFLVSVDATSDDVVRGFEETHQHKRKLIPVKAEIECVASFIKQMASEGKKISPYALCCMYNVAHALDGKSGAEHVANSIRETGGDIVIVTPQISGNVFRSALSNRLYD